MINDRPFRSERERAPEPRLTPDAEEEIEAIAEDYLESLRSGAQSYSLSLAGRHPRLAPWLLRRLELIDALYDLVRTEEEGETAGEDRETSGGEGEDSREPQP